MNTAGWRWGPAPSSMSAPDPTRVHPLPAHPRVVFLRPLITTGKISVGEYTYYDDQDHPENFERECVLYDYRPERLIIGRYCALASGVQFLMAGASHRMDGGLHVSVRDVRWRLGGTHPRPDCRRCDAQPG